MRVCLTRCLRSGAAVGEDGGAWSQPYYHAPAPWATSAAHAKGCHCPEGGECAVGATNCSCGNGSYLDGDCDGGPIHPRTTSFYSNATSGGLDMPDGMVETQAISSLRRYAQDPEVANQSKHFFLAVGMQ